MEPVIEELRALGVYIPEGLDDAALLRQAKLLNPFTVTVQPYEHGFLATTRKQRFADGDAEQEIMDSVAYVDTTATGAALNLLLEQLEAGKFTAQDTEYKQSSMAFRAVNP